MIVEFIIVSFFTVFTFLFDVFPDLPAMPPLIVSGWAWFINAIGGATGVLVYFLSTPLYLMAIGLIIFMTTFHYIYQFVIRFIVLKVAMRFLGK